MPNNFNVCPAICNMACNDVTQISTSTVGWENPCFHIHVPCFTIAFASVFFTTFSDWLENLAPLSKPIRCQTKTNRNLVAAFSRAWRRLYLLQVLIGSLYFFRLL